jgi:hypothetical protein
LCYGLEAMHQEVATSYLSWHQDLLEDVTETLAAMELHLGCGKHTLDLDQHALERLLDVLARNLEVDKDIYP